MVRRKAPEQMAYFAAFIRFAGQPGKERTRHDCASWRDAPPVIQPSVFFQNLHHDAFTTLRVLDQERLGLFLDQVLAVG